MSESYNFDPKFEQSISALLVTSVAFYNRMGPYLESERFTDKRARLLVNEATRMNDEFGKPPGSLSAVLQGLRARNEAGKLAASTIDDCFDYVTDADPIDPFVASGLASKKVQQLRKGEVLSEAITVHAEHGSMADIADNLQQIENIGKVDVSLGAGMDSLAQDIEELGAIPRLPTGFPKMDMDLGGGIPRGEFWFYLAGDKIGKSMQLTQTASIGCEKGLFVAAATLELDMNKWRARVMGASTGVPSQDILNFGSKSIALETWATRLKDEEQIFSKSCFRIQKFPGHQTPPSAVIDWVRRVEDHEKREIDVLVIDYADKLCGKVADGDYHQMRDVYEYLRLYAEESHKWVISASQATRIEFGVMPTKVHCADSQHKPRIADGMIGLTRYEEEDNQVAAKVLISRNVGDGYADGPLPNGFAYGCFLRNAAQGVAVEDALKEDLDPGAMD